MNKKLAISICWIVLLGMISFGVPGSPLGKDRPTVVWKTSLKQKKGETYRDMAVSSDSGVLLVGLYQTEDRRTDGFVTKLDKHGKVLWRRPYGGDRDDELSAVWPTSDGGAYLIGTSASGSKGWGDLWVLKINSRGDVLWERLEGSERPDFGHEVDGSSGNVFILGHVGFEDPHRYFNTMHLYDPGGSRLRTATFKKHDNFIGHSIAVSKGRVFLSGHIYHEHEEFGLFLEAFDFQASREWSVSYPNETPGDMVVGFDDSIAVATHGSCGKKCFSVSLRNFSNSGELQWVRSYAREPRDEVFALTRLQSGYIIGGSTSPYYSTGNQPLLMGVNRNGVLEWSWAMDAAAHGGEEAVPDYSWSGPNATRRGHSNSGMYSRVAELCANEDGFTALILHHTYEGGRMYEGLTIVRLK